MTFLKFVNLVSSIKNLYVLFYIYLPKFKFGIFEQTEWLQFFEKIGKFGLFSLN